MQKISVIIPNYNYQNYISQRIYSVLEQKHPVAELIFLDDASTDSSVVLAQEILQKQNIPFQIVKNEKNAGVFAQWQKGIALAQHEIIWIAEADDVALPNFLTNLLPFFEDEKVVFAHCQSLLIDEKNKSIGEEKFLRNPALFDDLGLWHQDFVLENKTFLPQLFANNPIINASACLFRKSAVKKDFFEKMQGFRMCGDWFFYLLLLQNPAEKIAYSEKIQNHFRRHTQSVYGTFNTFKQKKYTQELLIIQSFILKNFSPDIEKQSKMLHFLLTQNELEKKETLELLSLFDPKIALETIFEKYQESRKIGVYEWKMIHFSRKITKNPILKKWIKKMLVFYQKAIHFLKSK